MLFEKKINLRILQLILRKLKRIFKFFYSVNDFLVVPNLAKIFIQVWEHHQFQLLIYLILANFKNKNIFLDLKIYKAFYAYLS